MQKVHVAGSDVATMQGRKWVVETYGGSEKLRLVEFVVPSNGEELDGDSVVVKILATDATYTDSLIIRGNYYPNPPCPCTPGYDCIGVVELVGKNVTNVKIGDGVASMPKHSCCATHVVLKKHLVVKINSKEEGMTVPPTEAVALVLTGITAHQMLHRCGKQLDSTSKILVHACGGGTGSMIVQLALIAGVLPANIFGTCSNKSKAFVEKTFPGIVTFDYKDESWPAKVMQQSQNQGVDMVLDSVFLGNYFRAGLSCLKRGGKYVAYGVTNTEHPGTIPVPSILFNFSRIWLQNWLVNYNLSFVYLTLLLTHTNFTHSIRNSKYYYMTHTHTHARTHRLFYWFDSIQGEFYDVAARRDAAPAEYEQDLLALLALLKEKKLDVASMVGKTWSFEEANLAHKAIEENTHSGKQIISVASA